MKKPTSKSASATPKTSSQSGTSARTGATANGRPRKEKFEGKFAYLAEGLQAMSEEEIRQSLIRAGIIDANTGQLASKYQKGRKR